MESIVDNVFKIGIGPSSSHTVGPMRAANLFLQKFINGIDVPEGKKPVNCVELDSVKVNLYGSLALTGVGHATDKAILLGLLGETPESVDIDKIPAYLEHIKKSKTIDLLHTHTVKFDIDNQLVYKFRKALKEHANGMIFRLYNQQGKVIAKETYFSIGGGLIRTKKELQAESNLIPDENFNQNSHPLYFDKAKSLLEKCHSENCSIAQLMWKIEKSLDREKYTQNTLSEIWQTMQECVEKGINAKQPILPGGLNLPRRAPEIYRQLTQPQDNINKRLDDTADPAIVLDWVSLYALAVNEENACGNRVVTAPTNGSAGVIPAVMHFAKQYYPEKFDQQKAQDFLMVASAIGHLYQKGASISAAEMGCQGEIGVSCSMASAALCEFLGGNIEQVANAAEIGMEHHLGMTCDPIKGLVQIPCIERNTMGAIKAINSARLALRRNTQKVSLDAVIKTMFQTGKDMSTNYKETAQGGLATFVLDEDGIETKEYKVSNNQVAC